MDDPEYIVLVALDTPSRSTGLYISGGVMAAPTVGAVMADILPYLGIQQTFSQENAEGKTVVVPDLTGMTIKEAVKLLKEQFLTLIGVGEQETITGQIPAAGEQIPGGSQMLVYLGEDMPEEKITVPNFCGMHRQQASDAAGSLGLYILVAGNQEISTNVTVMAQSISAGTQVSVGTTVRLDFVDTKAAD